MEAQMVRNTTKLLLLACLACALLAGCGGSEPAATTEGLAEKGAEFVSLLAEGKFEEAATRLDPTMSAAMPPAKLEEAWKSLSSLGTYESQAGARREKERGFDVAYVRCAFEKGSVTVKVVFDRDGKVSGLWFV